MNARQYARAKAIADDGRADPNERANAARRCAEYEAAHGRPVIGHGLRPWWTLKISRKGTGRWLDNGAEFRNALRVLRGGGREHRFYFERSTIKMVQRGEVDWRWFPDAEPWQPPKEMLAVYDPRSFIDRSIGQDEDIVEWIVADPPPQKKRAPRPLAPTKRRREPQEGELPGCITNRPRKAPETEKRAVWR